MIKAIIFDCFGVLVGESLQPFYEKYFQGDQEKIRLSEEYMHLSNRGDATFDEYLEKVGKLAGISAETVNKELNANPRNEPLLSYIAERLKPAYKIGFLSNASDNWLDKLLLPKDIALFDATVISYETGYAKPEASIYEITADRLGVRLEECVFVDNRQDYCEGARGVGMQAIFYKDFEVFKRELEGMLA